MHQKHHQIHQNHPKSPWNAPKLSFKILKITLKSFKITKITLKSSWNPLKSPWNPTSTHPNVSFATWRHRGLNCLQLLSQWLCQKGSRARAEGGRHQPQPAAADGGGCRRCRVVVMNPDGSHGFWWFLYVGKSSPDFFSESIGWFKGKIKEKLPYVMGKSMVSCRFSL